MSRGGQGEQTPDSERERDREREIYIQRKRERQSRQRIQKRQRRQTEKTNKTEQQTEETGGHLGDVEDGAVRRPELPLRALHLSPGFAVEGFRVWASRFRPGDGV